MRKKKIKALTWEADNTASCLLKWENQKGQPTIKDHRDSWIGQQNWEVCQRMFVHDLLDLRGSVKEIDEVLKYYSVVYLPDGGYSMALPRQGIVSRNMKILNKGKKK